MFLGEQLGFDGFSRQPSGITRFEILSIMT
jgi:hypothetical protein